MLRRHFASSLFFSLVVLQMTTALRDEKAWRQKSVRGSLKEPYSIQSIESLPLVSPSSLPLSFYFPHSVSFLLPLSIIFLQASLSLPIHSTLYLCPFMTHALVSSMLLIPFPTSRFGFKTLGPDTKSASIRRKRKANRLQAVQQQQERKKAWRGEKPLAYLHLPRRWH